MNDSEKLSELFLLALRVNENTKFHVFFEFAGHVNSISLRITIPQKKNCSVSFFDDYTYLTGICRNFDVKFDWFLSILQKFLIPDICPICSGALSLSHPASCINAVCPNSAF